ncbi:MAG TPA: hypothetical protein PLU10_06655 [Chitinophagaceae bacterium]|jgi:hypothetical protein|nr:hypothetical protein [Chitinophagaceae bacterium]
MNTQNNQSEDAITVSDAQIVVYEQDKAQIDIQISTAKAYPRNVKRSVENSVAIVTLSKATAQTCTYAVPRAGKSISGPSVHLARILAQNWGNMRIEARVKTVEEKTITSEAIAFDLENNLAIKVEVKRSIMTKTGRMSDDMITVTGNAANAIALRNAIYGIIPKGVVDTVYDAAKSTIIGNVDDENALIARRKAVFDEFKNEYNVSEKEVLAAIGKPSISTVTKDDIVVIVGIWQAIKDGDTTVDDAFKRTIPKKDEMKQNGATKIDLP